MMIAAVHLRAGDLITDWPPADEPNFDTIYNSSPFNTEPGLVHRVDPRSGDNTRRFIAMIDGTLHCWDNTRLINVTQRNTS